MAAPAAAMSYAAPMAATTASPMMTGSYVAAPAMTSMAMPAPAMSYAAPMATAAMPSMAMSYAAPVAAMQSTGSFVSAPALPALPMAQMPAQPQSLTSGIPDPKSIEHQKHMYYKALDQQLQQAINGVMQRNMQYKHMIDAYAKQYKNEYHTSGESSYQREAMMVDQQSNAQMMLLQERAAEYKMVLEQQASALKLEYAEKKSMEDVQMRQYEIQKQYYESQRSLHQRHYNPGMMTQGQSMGNVTQGTGPTPLASVAANQAAGMLGPGTASSMITGGTAAGVGATQGVTNATMGASQTMGKAIGMGK